MVAIAHVALEGTLADPWAEIAARATAWADDGQIAMRDAVVLVPFAQHLALARRAWAGLAGWPPRIETTLTLARSAGPPPAVDPSQVSFDAALDRLAARRLMKKQAWGRAWQARDARGFDQAVHAVVQAAHAFARAAAVIAPQRRDAYWAQARQLLGATAGPGSMQRLLARVALEWAAAGGAPLTDRLFSWRPSAWIVVQAGGRSEMALALMSHDARIPGLIIDTDAAPADPFAQLPLDMLPALAVCTDFEAEAQRTAAQVIAELNAGRQPVALIAQDRLLMRRVRSLLSRQDVPLRDETGWKLSTTRSAAGVAALLRAAHRRATADDWLDWLKSCAANWPAQPGASSALEAIEATMRRAGWRHPDAVDAARLSAQAAALWRSAQQVVALLAALPRRSFSSWIAALRYALEACGAWTQLQSDDAGRQVIAALHLRDAPAPPEVDAEAMSLDEFVAWVDDALEEASFIPEPAAAQDEPVVITPLGHAMLRPFAAVVFPGTDHKRLGAAPPPHPLLSDALAAELGLPSAAGHVQAQTLAFAQVLRLPHLTLLHRMDDGGDPLRPSPLVERLRLAVARAKRGDLASAPHTLVAHAIEPQPVRRPAPSAAELLPQRLSASACEALRSCPYRFFARHLLSLREADELDDAVQKRDYGTWLHQVLHRFHLARVEPLPAAEEEARLREVAEQMQRDMRLDDAAFLPFSATFSRLAPRYVRWLHERDAQGAQWLEGERELSAVPPQWGGVAMHGVIDRIDSVPGAEGPVTQLIDYKTGSAQKLRQQVKQAQEDTQLAFYAALMWQQSSAPGDIGAAYLPLDEAEAIKAVEHEEVLATAQQLIEGVGSELARLREGAAMPALGEGAACAHCEARGLCRRDHWTADAQRP